MTLAVITGTLAMPGEASEAATDATEGPFGIPTSSIVSSPLGDKPCLWLARHGRPRRWLPHEINYRANLWALHERGVEHVLAVQTVGGISVDLAPGCWVLPEQIIDYTWGRAGTFGDFRGEGRLNHIEFEKPFSSELIDTLAQAAGTVDVDLVVGGTYACTQGPRLETAAEIDRLERDGATVVGMTAMPEAALARELNMSYASLCIVVNPAAGRGVIDRADMRAIAEAGGRVLTPWLEAFAQRF